MFGAFAPLPLRLGGTAQNGLTAAQHARVSADMVALVRSAPLAKIGLTTGSTAIRSYQAQWATGVPAAPTITAGIGWVKATWAEGFTDPFGGYQALRITGVDLGLAALTAVMPSYVINAPNVVTVYSYTFAGSLTTGIPVFLVVF